MSYVERSFASTFSFSKDTTQTIVILHVHIEGHGLAGFLNVPAGQDYSDCAFRETMP